MRLSKITTKSGDGGTTHYATNKRVSKGSSIIAAIGKVDSLNSQLGMFWDMLRWMPSEKAQLEVIVRAQQSLFDVGGELSMGHPGLLYESDLDALEEASELLLAGLNPLKEFVIPRGIQSVCQAHICRSVCREAEVAMVQASDDGFHVGALALKYINRLSDYLFNLARHLDHSRELLWTKNK